MGLLNFSTTIAAEKTVAEIQALLVKHHCRAIQTRYGAQGEVVGLSFTLSGEYGAREYALPINVAGVLRTLQIEKRAGRLPNLPLNRIDEAQARRVAWRIVKQWLEGQLALVQTRVLDLDQVLLPFQLVDGERTVYQVYQQQQTALPRPG